MMNQNDTVDTGSEMAVETVYEMTEVTTMTTETTTQATETATKTEKPAKVKKLYPFMTKAQIAEKINGDFDFACHVIVVLWHRQTQFEQETKSTLNRNRAGFMSSHAVHGSRLAEKIRNSETLTDEDVVRVQAMAPRYTKQIAQHLRDQAIEQNPELATASECYFTAQ